MLMYSVKELADMAGVTKPTMQKKVERASMVMLGNEMVFKKVGHFYVVTFLDEEKFYKFRDLNLPRKNAAVTI